MNSYLEKPIVVQTKSATVKMVGCCKCKNFFFIPTLPFCQECQNYLDNCQHGIACSDCAWKIIWQEIILRKLKVEALTNTQIREIQNSIQAKFQQTVYVDENNYLQIKSGT